MIDICTVVYKNYNLLDYQLEHWKKIRGDHRLLVCDNTPSSWFKSYDKYPLIYLNSHENLSDGESHGAALDLLVKTATTDIIGIIDSDFFWLNSNILDDVKEWFSYGCKCVGVSLTYPDYQRLVDPAYPDRAGNLAPCVFGMFVDRKLAMEQSFVCTVAEGQQMLYTGWRLRQRIIDEGIPSITYPGCYPEGWRDQECVFFGTSQGLQGVHFLKGSNPLRMSLTNQIPAILNRFHQ